MVHTVQDIKLTPFTARLKDGKEVLIREATIQDAPEIIYCVKTYISDSGYQVLEPEEFAPSIAQGREWIQSFIEEDNSIFIIAEYKEKIIGNMDITGATRRRIRHNGLVGMGMLNDYRRQGLGSILLQAGIDWAKENPILERLWLQILDKNESAVALYQKLGFQEEGRQKNFIKIDKDNYADNILMWMNVKD